MNILIITAICGLCIGILLQAALKYYLKWYSCKQAKSQAQDIVETAEELAEEMMDLAKDAVSDYENQLQEKNAKYFEQMEFKIDEIKTKVDGVDADLKSFRAHKERKYKKAKSVVDNYQNLVDAKQAQVKFVKEQVKLKKKDYLNSLSQHLEIDQTQVLEETAKKLISQAHTKINEQLETQHEDFVENSEREAKKIINRVLNRFIRPYCPERGIGFVILSSDKEVQRMLGPNKKNLELIEELCGVDVIYNERARSLSVSGFDPVRRELGRATIERLSKLNEVSERTIKECLEKSKVHLFKTIKKDGEKLMRELKIKNISKEISNMMGALRYRYSFTQNQYFHCAEVGHLCGLLSSELNLSIDDGRRAGMLHDIGKAMDHSLDGGHAVIGADFIEKHGEEEKIVHAVRAHHYDETPSTNLAFLVIAADAISGARPGARRSTAVSYMQKMDQLQEIGNSFDGVLDTFILSAGREVRITVDSASIDDHKALHLSQEIAKKIEQECNYPGTIKVTVVRSTQSIEMAR